MKKFIPKGILMAMLTTAVFCQGCYTYHIKPNDVTAATEYNKEAVQWFYAWGLWEGKKPVPECKRNGLADVSVRTTFGGSILTFVTLGIVHPINIKWKCHQCMVIE